MWERNYVWTSLPVKGYGLIVPGIAAYGLFMAISWGIIVIRNEYFEELNMKNNLLKQALKAQQDFTAQMIHEIRTPLGHVTTSSALLRISVLNDDQQELINMLCESSHHLLNLVNDILDFSKIQSSNLILEKKSFSVSDVIMHCIREVSHRAFSKGVQIFGILDESLPTEMLGDPTRLSQIVSNLCSNAVKFTVSGHICVRATISTIDKHMEKKSLSASVDSQTKISQWLKHNYFLHCCFKCIWHKRMSDVLVMPLSRKQNEENIVVNIEPKQKQRWIAISVEDTGIGLCVESQKKIFDAYVQAETSTNRRFGGTGLGLSISAELTKAMGGELKVHSKGPNLGSTFFFSIPMFNEDTVLEHTHKTICLKANTSSNTNTAFNIHRNALVFDSYPLSLSMIELALKPLFCKGGNIYAYDQSEIVKKLLRQDPNPIDVFICDFQCLSSNPTTDTFHSLLRIAADNHISTIVCLTFGESSKARIFFKKLQSDCIASSGEEWNLLIMMKPLDAIQLRDAVYQLCSKVPLQSLCESSRHSKQKNMRKNSKHFKTKHVLIVDDNAINCKVLERVLTLYGHTHNTFMCGREALDRLKECNFSKENNDDNHRFDAVITDIQMPEMNGWELAQEIRHIEALEDDDDDAERNERDELVIIACTAAATLAIQDQTLSSGMTDIIYKPFTPEQVHNKLLWHTSSFDERRNTIV